MFIGHLQPVGRVPDGRRNQGNLSQHEPEVPGRQAQHDDTATDGFYVPYLGRPFAVLDLELLPGHHLHFFVGTPHLTSNSTIK